MVEIQTTQQNNTTTKHLNQNNMEKSAVDWLVNELDLDMDLDSKWIIEQAKEIEKQQISDAWVNGGSTLSAKNAEQYYNETFKSK